MPVLLGGSCPGRLTQPSIRSLPGRSIAFAAVGAVGFGLQMLVLVLLVRSGCNYLAATALSVSVVVLHNFAWHQRCTWADRPALDSCKRLARFAATTGVTSLLGNVFLTAIYAGSFGLPAPVANALAVASLSVANFFVADRWVFAAGADVGRGPHAKWNSEGPK
jgi:putative flippase GtrA